MVSSQKERKSTDANPKMIHTDVRIITRKLENTIKTMFHEIKVNTFEVMQGRSS